LQRFLPTTDRTAVAASEELATWLGRWLADVAMNK
jgi:hypothetical protein